MSKPRFTNRCSPPGHTHCIDPLCLDCILAERNSATGLQAWFYTPPPPSILMVRSGDVWESVQYVDPPAKKAPQPVLAGRNELSFSPGLLSVRR